MQNNQEMKKIKFIFCLIILLSNATLFLLMNSTSNEEIIQAQDIYREDHITIKVKAELMVPFSTLIPVSLVSDKAIIRNVFLLKEIESSNIGIQDNFLSAKEYFIEVHKKEFQKIKNSKVFKIYPNEINHKLSKAKRGLRYELSY